MTSELYSRYIPPKKRKYENFDQLDEQPQSKRSKAKQEADTKEETKKKKVKKEERIEDNAEDNTEDETKDKTEDWTEDNTEGRAEEKTEKKTKRKKGENKRQNIADSSEDIAGRHKSLLSKRERSTKKAEKLANMVVQEAIKSEESVHDEAPAIEESVVHPLEPLPQPEPVPELATKPAVSALPAWLAHPTRVPPTAKSPFTKLGIPEEVAVFLGSKGFVEALAIQTAVIPLLLSRDRQQPRDVLVSAATGSGKTLAYLLPMVFDLCQTSVTRLRGVIVMPTRELVDQARKVCEICVGAFATKGRRRLKIGTANGHQLYATELTNLMYFQPWYHPHERKTRERPENQNLGEWNDTQPARPIMAKGRKAVICPSGRTSQVRQFLYEPAVLFPELKLPEVFNEKYGSQPFVHPSQDSQPNHKDPRCECRGLAENEPCRGGNTPESPHHVMYLPNHTVRSGPKIDILICTPGRLVHHLRETDSFTLDHLRWLVIDEADKLIEQSYQQWLDVVMDNLAAGKKIHDADFREGAIERHVTKVLLSATITRDLGKLSHLKLKSPKLVVLEGIDDASMGAGDLRPDSETLYTLPETLQEYIIELDPNTDKPLELLPLLKTQIEDDESTPIPSQDAYSKDFPSQPARGALVFTNSNEAAVRLSRLLKLLEPSLSESIGTITSIIPTSDRKRTLRGFNAGKLSIIIASDLVARGLDIPSLAMVINYDAPTTITHYVHRVGRTARAGKPGRAYTFTARGTSWVGSKINRAAGKEVISIGSIGKVDKEALDRYVTALAILQKEAARK